MSSYLSFYLRQNDTFIEIDTYSRGSAIYGATAGYAPYECIRGLSATDLVQIRENLTESQKNYKTRIAEYKAVIKEIGKWNNPIDEKMRAIYDKRSEIDELKDDIEELRASLSFINTLIDIEDNMRLNQTQEQGSEPEYVVYVGIESGSFVNVGDIKGYNDAEA